MTATIARASILILCLAAGCRSRQPPPESPPIEPAPRVIDDVPLVDVRSAPSEPASPTPDAASFINEQQALALVDALPETRAFAGRVARRRRTVGSDVTQEADVRCEAERCRWNIKVYEATAAANIAWHYFEVHPWTGAIRVQSSMADEWLELDAWRAAERDHK